MSDEQNSAGRRVASVVLGVALLGLAVLCFVEPDATDGFFIRPGGPKSLALQILVRAWGWPLGVVAGVTGGFAVLTALLPEEQDDA